MSMASVETSRSYTISFPPETALRLERLVKQEGRSLDEILDEAVRGYDVRQILRAAGEYGASLNSPYTEEDVPRLIAEVRVEERERELRK